MILFVMGLQVCLLSLCVVCVACIIILSKNYPVGDLMIAHVLWAFFGLCVLLLITYYHFFVRSNVTTYDNKCLYANPPIYYQYPPIEYLDKMGKNNSYHNGTAVATTTATATATSKGNIQKEPIRCYFNRKYYDLQMSKQVGFQCKESALENGFCSSHHKSTYEINMLDNTINDKINRLVEDGQEVFCIGYYIEFISIMGKRVYKPLHFHGATIRIADFRDAYFTEEATAYFVNTTFEEASFDGAKFHSKVLFNNSTVTRSKITPGYFHEWEDEQYLESRYSGYLSLRNAEFHDKANFQNSKIYGIVFFDGAKFFDDAVFDYCDFSTDEDKPVLKEASFYGNLSLDHAKRGDNTYPPE